MDNGICQGVNSSWTGKFVVHGQYIRLATPLGAIQLLRLHSEGGGSWKKQTKANRGRGGVVRSERSQFKRFQRRIIAAIT